MKQRLNLPLNLLIKSMNCIMKNHHQIFSFPFASFSFKANITLNVEYNYHAFYIRICYPSCPQVYKKWKLKRFKSNSMQIFLLHTYLQNFEQKKTQKISKPETNRFSQENKFVKK